MQTRLVTFLLFLFLCPNLISANHFINAKITQKEPASVCYSGKVPQSVDASVKPTRVAACDFIKKIEFISGPECDAETEVCTTYLKVYEHSGDVWDFKCFSADSRECTAVLNYHSNTILQLNFKSSFLSW